MILPTGTLWIISDQVKTIFSVELLDKSAQATELSINYEQTPVNTRLPNLLKAAFPMSDHKKGKLFIKIKSTNASQLDEAFESFISAAMMTIQEERMFGRDMNKLLESTRIQVGHTGNNCIILIPLDSTEVVTNFEEMAEKNLALLNGTGMRAYGSVGLGVTLQDLLKHVVHN